MPAIYHKDCGGSLLVDVSKGVTTLCDFSVQKTGLRIERLQLGKKKSKISSVFCCQTCGDGDLGIDDIQILCSYCSSTVTDLTDVNYYPTVGGFYCKKCAKRRLNSKDRAGEKRTKSVLSNISLATTRRI